MKRKEIQQTEQAQEKVFALLHKAYLCDSMKYFDKAENLYRLKHIERY